MDKWLVCLLITAVGLPLLMFLGNLKAEVSEAGNASAEEAGTNSVSEGLQEPSAASPGEGPYSNLTPNMVYFGGNWNNNPDSVELVSDEGRVVMRYAAENLNILADSAPQQSLIQVLLDGRLVNSTNSGSDVKVSIATVGEKRLYSLIMNAGDYNKTLEINVRGKGFRLYRFTFG